MGFNIYPLKKGLKKLNIYPYLHLPKLEKAKTTNMFKKGSIVFALDFSFMGKTWAKVGV